MKPKPLDLDFEEILSKEIDISDAKCEICKKKVEPEVIITGKFTLSKRYIDNGNFNSYWHCDNCGAVPAIINEELSENPLDLMNIPAVRINGELFISLQRIKSACEFFLRYKDYPCIAGKEPFVVFINIFFFEPNLSFYFNIKPHYWQFFHLFSILLPLIP